MGDIALTNTETKVLVSISIINLALFVGNFIFTIYNTAAYLCRLKVTKPLIILFYVLTYVMSVARIIETTSRVSDPTQSYFDYRVATWGGVSRSIGNCALLALGFLIVVTMY